MSEKTGKHAQPSSSDEDRISTADASKSAPSSLSSTSSNGKNKSKLKPIFIVLVIIIIACLCVMGYNWYQQSQAASKTSEPIVPEETSEPAQEQTVQLVNNPIDFTTLREQYPDTVGWISVPDTKVNYQVVRSTTDDGFYLDRAVDGNQTVAGAIYMEMANDPQFLDYVTVLYGHCLQTDAMFTTLHYFEDQAFFDSHPSFYIYTPGHILTYTIVSAFNYDDRHILNSFQFSDPAVRLSYYAMLQNPDSLVVNKRSGVQMTADSKIVQLSTCLSGYSYDNQRYIVTGVLTNDQLTY